MVAVFAMLGILLAFVAAALALNQLLPLGSTLSGLTTGPLSDFLNQIGFLFILIPIASLAIVGFFVFAAKLGR
jgi:hypothetical protein